MAEEKSLMVSVGALIKEAAEQLMLTPSETRLLNSYAFAFVRRYRSITNPAIRTQTFKNIPNNKRIKRPLNYMDWIRIGYVKQDGTVVNMAVNYDLARGGVTADKQALISAPPNSVNFPAASWPTPIGGAGVGEGITGSQSFYRPNKLRGGFTINEEDNTFDIWPDVYWPNWYMDYKSSCITIAKDMYLTIYAHQACVNYIKHHFTFDRYNDGRKDKYLDQWEESKEVMEDAAASFTFEDFINNVDLIRGYTE